MPITPEKVTDALRRVVDPIIQRALGTDLAALEQQIDHGPAPQSRVLEG